MSAAKTMEHQITRRLLRRRVAIEVCPQRHVWVERLVAVIGTTVAVFVLGSYLQELLWVLLAAGTIYSLSD